MATKSFKELKNLSKDELVTKVREYETKFFQAKIQHATGQLKDTASLWRFRKGIARIKMLQASGTSRASEGTSHTARKGD